MDLTHPSTLSMQNQSARTGHCDAHAIAAPVLLHYQDYSGESLDAGP